MANQNVGGKRAAEDNLLLAKRIRVDSSPDEPLSVPLDAVCYGMVRSLPDCDFISSVFAKITSQLIDLNCQLLRGGPKLDTLCLLDNDIEYVALRLTLDERRITIGSADQSDFAQLNSLAASVLHGIAHNVTLKAYVSRKSCQTLLDMSKSSERGALARFKLNINVFGLRSDSVLVGETLSNSDLFLQEPYHRTENLDYNNPHVWTFDNLPDIDIWLAGLSRGKPISEQMIGEHGWNQVLDGLSNFDSGHKDLEVSCLSVQLLKCASPHPIIGIKLTRHVGTR
jgi:hypothetical protein